MVHTQIWSFQGLAAMDAGARDSLADVISKSLVKLATQPEGKVIIVVEKICLDFWVNFVACFD